MSGEPDLTMEQRLRAAVDSAPSGLIMLDSSGNMVLVNREVERMFGYDRAALLGRSIEMLVPDRFSAAHPAFRAMFFADPSARSMGVGRELFGKRRDGSEVPVEIGLTPVATDEGMFVISSVVDISARKRADARFKAAVESSPNGMVMVDSEGKIVLVNRQVERMFGYQRAELLGQSIEILVPQRYRVNHPEFRNDYYRDPQVREMGAGRELYGVRKDGSEMPVEIGLNPLETEDGLFVLSSIVDISARKAAETERLRLEAQLRQAQKMEAVGTLAGGVAHDFNNILGAIVGYAEMLADEVTSPQGRSDLADLITATQRGRELVQRILAFSRHSNPARHPVVVTPALEEAIRLLRATLPSSIAIESELAAELPPIVANITSVQQIVMNLGTNASHAMPQGGRLVFRLASEYVHDHVTRRNPSLREGFHVVLAVEDSGYGMDRQTLDRALEPFFTTKPPGAGSGLGLSMVHGIMTEHAGAVEISSTPGAGTTVRCYFPQAESDEVTVKRRSPVRHRGNGEAILFVDDEPSLVRIGVRRLSSLGYRPSGFTSSEEALAAFLAAPESFQAVVSDNSMPRMNGLQLARAIADSASPVPFILMTGYLEGHSLDDKPPYGIVRVVQKPVTDEELSRIVHELFNRRE